MDGGTDPQIPGNSAPYVIVKCLLGRPSAVRNWEAAWLHMQIESFEIALKYRSLE